MEHVQVPVTSIVITFATPTRNGKTHVEVTARPLIDGVWVAPGETVTARRDRDALRVKVQNLVTSQVAKLKSPDFRLEFTVREIELGLPFDEWEYWEPGATQSRPMRSVPLIVRDVARLNPGNIFLSDRIRKRWDALHNGGVGHVEPVKCQLPYDYQQYYDLLDADQRIGAVAYASSPRAEWIKAALFVGIPVMLWCRRDCPADDQRNPSHNSFLEGITSAASAVSPDRLPAEVARLRKEARSPVSGGEYHLGRHLTLFWDDPARLTDPPLGGS
jgi:hypothetical protein